jgi:hypothetical protein
MTMKPLRRFDFVLFGKGECRRELLNWVKF